MPSFGQLPAMCPGSRQFQHNAFVVHSEAMWLHKCFQAQLQVKHQYCPLIQVMRKSEEYHYIIQGRSIPFSSLKKI